MRNRQTIIVGGGGGAGITTALQLALVGIEPGEAAYNIIVLEEAPHLFTGSSLIAQRSHLWAEYPYGGKTAKDGLRAAMLWKLAIPSPLLYTDEAPLSVYVSQATHDKALSGDGEAITFEDYAGFYSGIQLAYEELLEQIAKLTGHSIEFIAERTFGKPEDLMRLINPGDNDLRYFEGRIRGGIETQEKGFRTYALLSALEKTLREQDNVIIHTNTKINHVEPVKAGPNIIGYRIHCNDGTSHFGSQFVQCTGPGAGFTLNGGFRDESEHQQYELYGNALVEADTSGIDPGSIPGACMVMKGNDGGMFSPITDSIAMLYHPGMGRIHQPVILDSRYPEKRGMPPEMRRPKFSPGEENVYMHKYLQTLIDGPFPFLKGAVPTRLFTRYTQNFDIADGRFNRDARTFAIPKELKNYPGFIIFDTTKFTHIMLGSIVTTNLVKRRTLYSQNGYYDKGPELNDDEAYILALESLFSSMEHQLGYFLKLDDLSPFLQFLKRHNLPASASWEKEGRLEAAPVTHKFIDDLFARRLYKQMLNDGSSSFSNRTFGLGFGSNRIVAYEDLSPKTGLVLAPNDPNYNKKLCAKVAEWCNNPEDERSLNEVLPQVAVANAIANRFLFTDMVKLTDLSFPVVILMESTPEALQILFNKDNIAAAFSEDSWNLIKREQPDLPTYKNMLRMVKRNYEFLIIDDKFENARSVMFPSLYLNLNLEEKILVSYALANALHKVTHDKKFFAKLALENVNIPTLEKGNTPMLAKSISSTGRAIKINFQFSDNLHPEGDAIILNGEKYYPVEIHFHPIKRVKKNSEGEISYGEDGRPELVNDIMNTEGKPEGKFEFSIFKNPAQALRISRHEEEDPHADKVGELHFICMKKDDDGQRRALALCAHVKLGEENIEMAAFTSRLEGKLDKEQPIKLDNMPFNPLGFFNRGGFIDRTGLLLAPFVSMSLSHYEDGPDGHKRLKAGSSDLFGRGVHAIHLPASEAVVISAQELSKLCEALPVLDVGFTDVGPVPRYSATIATRSTRGK